jgi:hypothetical protein
VETHAARQRGFDAAETASRCVEYFHIWVENTSVDAPCS